MKKIMLLGLIVVQTFVFSASATTYLWSSTNFCHENERIYLDKDFRFEYWDNGNLQFEGTWEFDAYDEDAITLTIEVEGTSRELHLRVVDKGRGIVEQYDNYVFIKKIEFNEAEYVKDEYCN